MCRLELSKVSSLASLSLPGAEMAKSITLNASPTWSGVKDDYVLRYEGHAIGRIRRAETAWEWHISIPMALPEWARGSADNLEECRKALAEA